MVQTTRSPRGELAEGEEGCTYPLMIRMSPGQTASTVQMNGRLPKRVTQMWLKPFPCFRNLKLSSPGSSRWLRHPTISGLVVHFVLCSNAYHRIIFPTCCKLTCDVLPQELLQFRTTGGKLKKCVLTVLWPNEMTFTANAGSRVAAEKRAAALACMKLKVSSCGELRRVLFKNCRIVYLTCISPPVDRSWSYWIRTTTH